MSYFLISIIFFAIGWIVKGTIIELNYTKQIKFTEKIIEKVFEKEGLK